MYLYFTKFIYIFLFVSLSTQDAPVPLTCDIYASSPRPNLDEPNTKFPYSREAYDSNLIDMTYLQNVEEKLVGGDGWVRTKRLLEMCKTTGVTVFLSDVLFNDPIRFISKWFQNYGCSCVEVSGEGPSLSNVAGKVWAAISIRIPPDIEVENLILIQTEQMTAEGWVNSLRDVFLRCKASSTCVVWEFSESNVRHAKVHYKTELPTIILPTTLRRDNTPQHIIPINERSHGYVFFGYGNARRDPVTVILDKTLTRWNEQNEKTIDGFKNSMLCISVHYYGVDSGLELHRLAQHVPYGCFPLYETPGDPVVVKLLNQQGVMLFAHYGQFTETAAKLIQCIKDEPLLMLKQQNYVQQWWSYELLAFEKVLQAFFDTN